MKYTKQRIKHLPPHAYGDCHRTAIACVLNLFPEQVPHFFDGAADDRLADDGHERCAEFLLEHGIYVHEIMLDGAVSLQTALDVVGSRNPKLRYLLGGTSVNGTGHTVVCLGADIVFDPSPDAQAGKHILVGPIEGYWWVTFFGHRFADMDEDRPDPLSEPV